MRKLLVSLLVVAALVSSSACSKKESAEEAAAKSVSGTVTALGTSTAMPLVKALADAFQKKTPAVSIEPSSSNSNWGLGALRNGMVDIALSSKPPEAEDKNLVGHPVARDGLCMIVNKENPVEALSDEHLKGIFQGTIKNWNELGGKDAPIERLNHAEVRTSLAMFVGYLGLTLGDIKYTETVISEDPGAIASVANDPNAVTYVSIGSALNGIADGKAIKMIGLRGVAPTVANVENGTVPVIYDINLVTKDNPKPAAKAFVDFAASSEAVAAVKAANFAPKK